MNDDLLDGLHTILKLYQDSFVAKVYSDENDDIDILMRVFNLTPALKRENRQYWGARVRHVLATACHPNLQGNPNGFRIGFEN